MILLANVPPVATAIFTWYWSESSISSLISHFPQPLQFFIFPVILIWQSKSCMQWGRRIKSRFGRVRCWLDRTRWLFNSTKDCWTFSLDTPANFPIRIINGKRTFATIPRSLWEKRISFPRRMVKMRRRPPEIIRNTKTARAKLKISGRNGWIFFNPTKGTYQSRKMKKKRIKQVKTSSPIKILFFGLFSNGIPYQFGVISS